jgi:glycosyltransferase involved in cell wall biosynthesis
MRVEALEVREEADWGLQRPAWGRVVERVGEVGPIARADLVASVSPLVDEQLAALGIDERRRLVVPNGVDLDQLSHAGAARPATRPCDVIFVGRLIAAKRVDLLLRAIARLAERRPWIRCEIVGDGPERERLLALTRDLGIESQVTLTGRLPQEELPLRLGSARILAMPSAREGYGITVVEGQAVGAVPIVARSPLSAAPDLVEHGVDGLVVDGTVEAFAGAIAELLDHPGQLDLLSAAARTTAAGRGWDDRAADMERIYANLVTGGARTVRRADRRGIAEAANWSAGG